MPQAHASSRTVGVRTIADPVVGSCATGSLSGPLAGTFDFTDFTDLRDHPPSAQPPTGGGGPHGDRAAKRMAGLEDTGSGVLASIAWGRHGRGADAGQSATRARAIAGRPCTLVGASNRRGR
ncbi:MAG TPA: hypothetical protein VG452_00100 [Egibacteraceae bacterium]|nr:hypothetical protein [Egibacteraceae bacterium]